VLLIGSGPSAKLLTADQVQHFQNNGGSIAVMNGFFLTELSKEITVDYYFIADPCFWEEKFLEIKTEIESYVKRSRNHIKIVQPAHLKPIVENYANYLFWDGRSRAGLVRSSRPDKPWGLPASVALYAIGTLKFLGHKRLFFTGLDSSYVNYYKVNDLNYVSHSPQGQHSYDEDERTINLGESGSIEVKHQRPFRHLADLNFAHGIFLRDMYWLCHDYCINVGNDTTNDSAPRASLLPRM
jgi:prepilin-type processing-associated H-X9-DG protein